MCVCMCVCVCVCEQNFRPKYSLRRVLELLVFGFSCVGWGKPKKQCSNKKYFSGRFCHTEKLAQSENWVLGQA